MTLFMITPLTLGMTSNASDTIGSGTGHPIDKHEAFQGLAPAMILVFLLQDLYQAVKRGSGHSEVGIEVYILVVAHSRDLCHQSVMGKGSFTK